MLSTVEEARKTLLMLYQLSRVYLDDASCSVILAMVPAWMVELSNSYDRDHKAQQLIMQCLLDPGSKINTKGC